MATAINKGGIRPVTLPPVLAFIMGVPVASREAVERVIQRAIDALDEIDGDADFESVGLEDDFEIAAWQLTAASYAAGCLVSDPDEAVDDRPCDAHEEGF